MRWKTGRLFKIKLSNGGAAFALALDFPEFAFFNCFNPDATIQEILKSGVLWRLWVMKHVLKEPSWQPMAVVTDIPKNLQQATPRFKKDQISGQYTVYIDGVESPATKEQCIGLESAAVWSALHLQDRLQDHVAGMPNRWVESLLP